MRALFVLALVALTASQVSGQAASTASAFYSVPFPSDKKYTLTYNILNQATSNPTLNATLSITGIDTSKWTTDGKSGLWLGIGYGRKVMANTDYNMCLLFNTGKTTDAFVCGDGSFDASRIPVAGVCPRTSKLKM